MPFKSLSNKSFLRVFIITLSLFAGIAMQAQKLTDAEIKTALIYNFLKYTEHPDFSHKDTLYIGVYGDDATMISSLGRLEKQKIKGKRLKLVFLGEQIIVPGLDAYYLLNEYNFEQSRIFKELQEKPILFITDRAEEKRQVMINFIHPENNTIQFEINSKNLNEVGFSISPKLLVLGGSELDVRELYKETEKSLISEQEKAKQIELELNAKKEEVSKLTQNLYRLYNRIDSLNSIIIFQIENIHHQQHNLDSLNKQLAVFTSEAVTRKNTLDSINKSLILRNQEKSRLDNRLIEMQQELVYVADSLNELTIQKTENEKTLEKQSDIIASQYNTILVFFAFLVVLLVLIIVIYFNYKANKKKNLELQRNKEQIEFQAEELIMKNLELEKLSLVAEKTDNAVIILDKSGEIEWVNNGFERMQECKFYEFKELRGGNFIQASNNSKAENFFQSCIKHKLPVTYDSHIETKSAQTKWLQSTLTPVLDKDGNIERFVVIDTDITKLKEAEKKILKKNIEIEEKAKILSLQAQDLSKANQELEKQRDRAEKALKKLQNAQSQLVAAEKMASLGQLTSGIAHEINNPINYISSSIEGLINILDDVKLLVTAYDNNPVIQEHKEIIALKNEIDYYDLLEGFDELTGNIKLGIDRTKEIVTSLRNFSRVDEDNYSEIDINRSIDSAIILLGKHHKDHITINKDFSPIPPVECMAGKVNQVFLNVLVNSVQAIEDKGEINIRTRQTKTKGINYATIDFIDSGKGIPEEIQEKIFEPFFTTKDVGEGTGLGLSITYSIIKKHNGFINIDSEINKGTTISINLPIKKHNN